MGLHAVALAVQRLLETRDEDPLTRTAAVAHSFARSLVLASAAMLSLATTSVGQQS